MGISKVELIRFLYEQVQERLIYNSLDAMKRIKMVLTNHRGKQSISKSMMLRYLIHIVGDIHQPLHNTNFYNTTHTTGDLGGNNMKIIVLKWLIEAVEWHNRKPTLILGFWGFYA
jgi:hypothetical protein